MNWHYRVKAPDEKVRDPLQDEFFSTEAIKNPADALVRERRAERDGCGLIVSVNSAMFWTRTF